MTLMNLFTHYKSFAGKLVPVFLSAAGCLAIGANPARAQRVFATAAPDEILFALRPNARLSATDVSSKIGAIYGHQAALNAYRAAVAPGHTVQDTIRALKANPDVLYAEPNFTLNACRDKPRPTDTYFSQQYAPQLTQADVAWSVWHPTTNVTLAIVDTGVDSTHPDLTNKMLRDAAGNVVGYNATDKSANAMDDHYHGTHCAGIAAAEGNNGAGITGIAGWDAGATNYVHIMPVKVLDSTGSGYTSWVSDGIVWAADHGAKVISMSLGGPDANQTLTAAVAYAWSKGAVIVAAAGNDGVNTKFYPAASDHVISVGAVNSSDALTSFSNYGAWVKVAAPGLNIFSTMPGGQYGSLSGTSMAGPHVAGEAALLLAQYPALSNDAVSALILAQTDPVAAGSPALAPGAGRINVYKALMAAAGSPNPVGPPALALQFTLSPTTVADGGKSAGTLTLNLAAPKIGLPVTLSSNSALVTFSGAATVESGKTTKTFPLTAGYPDQDTPVLLTVTSGAATASATLTVKGVTPKAVTLSTLLPKAAGTYTFNVALDHATTNGKAVILTLSSSSSIVTVPALVTVAAGQSGASFDAALGTIDADTKVTLTATANGGHAAVDLMLKSTAANLDGITLTAPQITGGAPDALTVHLTNPAPAGGAVITLSADNPGVNLPVSVTVPAGKTSAVVALASVPVAIKTTVTLSAAYKSATKTATVNVLAPSLTGFTLPTGLVTGGKTVTGTITLGSAAPSGGLTVTLFGPNVPALPASVTVAGGAKSATFTFTAPTIARSATFPIAATLNGVTKPAILSVSASASAGKK